MKTRISFSCIFSAIAFAGLAVALVKVQKDKSMGEYSGAAQISEDRAVTDASVDIEKLD